jgi:hypothetical protein
MEVGAATGLKYAVWSVDELGDLEASNLNKVRHRAG